MADEVQLEVQLKVASDPRWLRLTRDVVGEFLARVGFAEPDCRDVKVAVGEAVSNVMKHSYKGDPCHKLDLVCREANGGVEIEVRDRGEPFDCADQADLPPDELRVGGRGLFLMRAIMDEVEYSREGETNLIRLKKHRPAASD